LPNHGPAGLPLSPPGITCTALGCERRASATKRRAGPLPNMTPFTVDARGLCDEASTTLKPRQ
jgi:hypothetical protein